ncbi:MAG: preprotein translocase subunit SecG [Candidatus Omnitrophica bacterium]|nr:preprotein translocase subunit SecG [Candidatus Omnitrophota bacterium]
MTFIIIIHVIVCIGLIALVLIQRGRGGGLVESFAGVESMFGTKTSAFLTRMTTILSIIFFISCLTLAILAVRQSRSLMKDVKEEVTPPAQAQQEAAPEVPEAE